MIYTTAHPGEITVVRPGVERLTAVNAGTFKAEVCELVDAGASLLVIDFEEVSFLDSSGLGALIGILKKIGHRGDLTICGLGDELEHVFRVSRMNRVFTSYRDVAAAVESLNERL